MGRLRGFEFSNCRADGAEAFDLMLQFTFRATAPSFDAHVIQMEV